MTTEQTETLPEETRSRILRAIGRMPYGGIVHGPPIPQIDHRPVPDLEFVAGYLEALRSTLEQVAAASTKRDARLSHLEGLLLAGRTLMAELIPGASS